MSEPSKTDVIEIEEPTPTAPVAAVVPTRDELKKSGWSKDEMDRAEKRGMIPKPEDKKPVVPPAAAAPKADEKPPVAAPKAEEKPPEPAATKGSLPEYTFTPEEEEWIKGRFGPGHSVRAFYFRAKNERRARQEKDGELQRLRAELDGLKAALKTPAEIEVDPNTGKVVDPDEKPLTLKALKELQKAEAEALSKQTEEETVRSTRLRDSHHEQEEYARAVYPDFDPTMALAKDLAQNLDSLVPEKWKQAKVVQKLRELQVAAARADQYGLEDYHAAHIAYELGQLHPKYGKSDPAPEEGEETGISKDPKLSGAKPETVKRIENNTQRRTSSAAIGEGGGKRTVSAQDMDLKTLLGLPAERRLAFKKNYPDVYTKLMRG